MTDLLPANSTPAERAISVAMDRAGAIPTPAGLMWDAARIPAEYLPWLARAVSVDHWDPDWSDAQKRAAIAGSAAWHRLKGTRGSVITTLAQLGHAGAGLIEDRDLPRLGDAGLALGSAWRLGPTSPYWGDYWVEIQTRIQRPAADQIRSRLAWVVPARCRLRDIRLTAQQYLLGDGHWLIGDDVAVGNIYIYEV
ncbi:MAG: phage tail protein I [Paracoccus aminovorans]|nr:phage tail protein I [Paracoccus aminovorans]